METTMIARKEILLLLLADMRNRKLLSGLQAAGLDPEDFYTDLSDLILRKMGFEQYHQEELCTWYEQTMDHLIASDIRYFNEHQRELASNMYEMLLFKKDAIQQKQSVSLTCWGKEMVRKIKRLG